jgi:AAA+ ATPase superfamily predicted ATPase
MNEFVDRREELDLLADRWARGRAEALIMLGRRRVGKSRLLEHFFVDKPCIYLVGTREAPGMQLADASREVLRILPDLARGDQPFDSWSTLLDYVGDRARTQRLGFVLDEFAFLCDESPELPSVLQRWWDRVGQRGRVMLVLSSSHVAFMEREVLGGEVLYGRRTGELRMRPFDYYDAGRFLVDRRPVDRIRTYAVFGGMAAYLARCDDARSLAEDIAEIVLRREAYLRHEPQYLLSQERSIDRPTTYLSVLRAIAAGETQPGRIAQAAGFRAGSDIFRILERLQEFRLVDRLAPVTDRQARVRSALYVLTDNFLAFWFRFVAPHESTLERGAAGWLLAEQILPALDAFVSRGHGPWEEACREYLWRAAFGRVMDLGFTHLGPWWESREGGAEVDALALDGPKVVLAASCKWRNDWVKVGDLNELVAAAARAGADAETRYVLFSRSGFDPHLVALAAERGVRLVTPEDMFDPALEK